MSLQIRAIMIDAPRLIEKDSYYRELIRMVSSWGINSIIFRLTDSEGTALNFDCLPYAKKRHQYSKERLKDLVHYAERHNITLIPEVECLGHCTYITEHPGFEDIMEGYGQKKYNNEWRVGLCVSNQKTYDILSKILAEVVEIFPSQYLHIGCDEALMGICYRCKSRLKTITKEQLFVEHVIKMHKIVKSLGKKVIIWGDQLVNQTDVKNPIRDIVALNSLPKDVIIANWFYEHTVNEITTRELTYAGYHVLTCPALHWCRAILFPSKLEIENVRKFINIAHRYSNTGVIGCIVTAYCPYRYIQDTMWHSFAMAGRMMSEKKFQRKRFEEEFSKQFLGTSQGHIVQEAFKDFYNSGVALKDEFPSLFFDSDSLFKQASKFPIRRIKNLEKNSKRAKKLFVSLYKCAKKGRKILEACILGMDIVIEGCKRVRFARTHYKEVNSGQLKTLIGPVRILIKRVSRLWNTTRFSDDSFEFISPEEIKYAYFLAHLNSSAKYKGVNRKTEF